MDFSGSTFTIEHIMPQNALASAEWRETLGPDCESIHEELVNALGNLTLTAYNPELSDASFAEKKVHPKGGFEKDGLVILMGVHNLDVWDRNAICVHVERLVEHAWTGSSSEQRIELMSSTGRLRRVFISEGLSI